MTEIVKDRIWLGSVNDLNKDFIGNNNIKRVICVCQLDDTRKEIEKLVDEYYKFSIPDSPKENIIGISKICYYLIYGDNTKDLKTFIYCAAGISRSASVVIYILMKKEGIDYKKAFEKVKEKRKVVNPNDGFTLQLLGLGVP